MAERDVTSTPPGEMLPHDSLHAVLVVGDYGSGKTEVSVNLALHAAGGRDAVALADLDLVNPYFRSREAAASLIERGVRVVMPEGGHKHADLPILLPSVKGLLQDRDTFAILDVGGDEVGARVLAAMAPAVDPATHGFWFVVNKNRPFTDTVDGCVGTVRRIEGVTGLTVSGIISNTHLMGDTTADMVTDGLALCRGVAGALSVDIALVAVMDDVARQMTAAQLDDIDAPLLVLQRIMVPPWMRRANDAGAQPVGPGQFKLGAGGD